MSEVEGLKLFLYTVKEYKRFDNFFSMNKKHSIYDGYTEEEYIGIQTKLMLLRKYASKGVKNNVYLGNILELSSYKFPQKKDEFEKLKSKLISIEKNEMKTYLGNGKDLNLYSVIEDVMYGLYLHADCKKIDDLTKIDQSLLFVAVRKYVEDFELAVLDTYDLLNELVEDKYVKSFEKAPIIYLGDNKTVKKEISGSPYWSNMHGKDATSTELISISEKNTDEDNYIFNLCIKFIFEAQSDTYSVKTLESFVFPPTRGDWGDFSSLHKILMNEKDIGWSSKIRYNEKHDMAYFTVYRHVKEPFIVNTPHILSNDVCAITLVNTKKYGWRIYCIGEKKESFEISFSEMVKKFLNKQKRKN